MRKMSRALVAVGAAAGLLVAAAPAAFSQHTEPAPTQQADVYKIRSDQQFCLAEGAPVTTGDCGGGPATDWEILPTGQEASQIVQAGSGLCLTASEPGGPVELAECTGDPLQLWVPDQSGQVRNVALRCALHDNGAGRAVTCEAGQAGTWEPIPIV